MSLRDDEMMKAQPAKSAENCLVIAVIGMRANKWRH
jgi:hypothetical protein